MLSSARRPERKLQQRLEPHQKDGTSDRPPSPSSREASLPSFHFPLPPTYTKLEGRSTSIMSGVSELSMDEFSGTHDSILEYSDTSGEEREDAYFMPGGAIGENKKLLGEESAYSGESVFRQLRSSGTKSSRVSKYTPNSSKNGTLKSWVESLAYSFRSPKEPPRVKGRPGPIHRKQPSWGTMEYPNASIMPWRNSADRPTSSYSAHRGSDRLERTPLLQNEAKVKGAAYGSEYTTVSGQASRGNNGKSNDREKSESKARPITLKSKSTAATIAAFFLMDYEAGRPPTLQSNFDTITPWQLQIYRVQFSWMWRLFGVNLSIIVLFLAHSQNRLMTALMHTYAITFFFIEVWMREQLYASDPSDDDYHTERQLNRPLILFLLVLGLESWVWFIFPPDPHAEVPALVSSFFKPIVFFYVSLKARHALEGLYRITRIVARVILIEMLLILAFASVACQLFHKYESFKNLSSSWLSLFELSTTVVNPSLWMPMYEVSRANAIFFVFYIVVSVFYMHSLVLSVVFQTYILATTEIHERSVIDREEAIRRAFLALLREESSDYISASSVRKALQIVRPHYNALKIKALMDILDPTDQHAIDYPTFRTKIRQALNASIRTARSNTSFAMLIELIAVAVAVLNFAYVLLSSFSAEWFESITISGGSLITFLGMFELAVRFNPTRISNFTPITRLNPTFDGLALIGAMVSCVGIFQSIIGVNSSVDYLLMGRAIDTIRMMRFFPMFRDVVRRSADVLPAMSGPLLMVSTIVHFFASLGIALWGGAIDTEMLATLQGLTPLYYLNNFNSYFEGLVTIFNVLVVNDWHAIAQVFLHANRCSSPYIVYPFFVATICCAVFIMLNVITAFFVESFVTKIDEGRRDIHDDDDDDDDKHIRERNGDRSLTTNEKQEVKRISRGLKELSEPADEEPFLAEDVSAQSAASTVFAFDVYEREGFDQIMRTVAGGNLTEDQDSFARSVCDYLEVFESLAPGREKVGYMICCQHSMNRFGNRRFQTTAKDYMKAEVLHKVVSDLHAELLVLSSRKKFDDRCLVRSFPHKTEPSLRLEIAASLIRHQPAVSLLVSRVRPASSNDP